jgi:hypothetical protein
VVGGDLGGHRRRVAGVQPLQGAGDAPVEVAAPGRAESQIGDLPDPVVGEVVGIRPLVPDHAAPPQLVQAADQVQRSGLAGLGEHVGGELPPDGRGDADQVAGRPGELGEPGLDHSLDPGGDRRGRAPPGPPGAHRLDHEQRVALGLGEQAVDVRILQQPPEQALRQGRRLLPGKAPDLDLDDQLQRPQPGQQGPQGW